MRRLLTASALLMALSATPGMTQDYPWCVGEINQASLQCRFTSYEQCKGTAMGTGECYQNPFYKGPGPGNDSPPAANLQQPNNNGRQKRQPN
jgi:Protein of unknown function (DUF3551)